MSSACRGASEPASRLDQEHEPEPEPELEDELEPRAKRQRLAESVRLTAKTAGSILPRDTVLYSFQDVISRGHGTIGCLAN